MNEGASYPLWRRLLRFWLAYLQQRRNVILDFEGKARTFSRLEIPRDPDVVFFGAEVGWEAALVQALFGNRGQVLLIDNDRAAFRRYLNAPEKVTIRDPRRRGGVPLEVRRDLARTEYLRRDLFDVKRPHQFDVGIDWGLIEHFQDSDKPSVLAHFKGFLKPSGLQISSCPRNCLPVRLFYRAFSDELNFGYRELMNHRELRSHLERAGLLVERTFHLRAHIVAASRWRPD